MTPEQGARNPLVWHFPRIWAMRHDEPKMLPNGRDWTNPRGSIRDNIRGQRSARRHAATEAGDRRDWSHYPAAVSDE